MAKSSPGRSTKPQLLSPRKHKVESSNQLQKLRKKPRQTTAHSLTHTSNHQTTALKGTEYKGTFWKSIFRVATSLSRPGRRRLSILSFWKVNTLTFPARNKN